MALIILVFAFVFACLAAAGVAYWRIHFGWLAFALFLLVQIVGRGF